MLVAYNNITLVVFMLFQKKTANCCRWSGFILAIAFEAFWTPFELQAAVAHRMRMLWLVNGTSRQ